MPFLLFPSFLSPVPLMWVLSCLRVSINPPPPGVGCANGRTVCDCGRDDDLLASYRVVSLSHCVRSLSSCLLFGSYSRASFFLLTGSGLGDRRRAPSSFRPVFPVPCVSCFASRRRRFSASRRPPAFRPLCSSRSSFRLASPSFVPIVGLLASSISVSWRSCSRASCGITPFRPSPRPPCRGTGRLAVPVFPIVSGGSLLGVPFLMGRSFIDGWSSRPVPPSFLLACPASVSCGMAAVIEGRASLCPCVPLASLLACPASARALAAWVFRVACPRYAYRPAPRYEGRGDTSRFGCSFSFVSIRR